MFEDQMRRISSLRIKLVEAWELLALDAVREEIDALEAEINTQDFWSDQELAKRETQKLSELRKEHDAWDLLKRDLADLAELANVAQEEKDESFASDIDSRLHELEQRYLAMEFNLLFSGKHDADNAFFAIHAGAGGTDAQDWAEMLLRMFLRYTERKGWIVQLVDESRGGEAGIKSATLAIRGRHAYGHLKGEHGVHRLVRQSPFNADALRQTSFALVEVVPEIDEDVSVEIKPEDLRIDTFMSGGKGGQSVNTTYSAVRIVHLPTNITVSCQNERSQTQNKEMAMKILKAKLVKLREEALQQEKQKLRGEFKSAEWGNQIRSYVLHPYKMVKDHRTDVETSDTERVLNGDLDEFVEGYLRWQARDRDVRAELNRDDPA